MANNKKRWYIVQTSSGKEDVVARDIMSRAHSLDQDNYIFDAFSPDSVELVEKVDKKTGTKTTVEKRTKEYDADDDVEEDILAVFDGGAVDQNGSLEHLLIEGDCDSLSDIEVLIEIAFLEFPVGHIFGIDLLIRHSFDGVVDLLAAVQRYHRASALKCVDHLGCSLHMVNVCAAACGVAVSENGK